MCLAQGPQSSDLMRLEPTTPWSPVKHSTTEPLHSLTDQAPFLFDTLMALKIFFKNFDFEKKGQQMAKKHENYPGLKSISTALIALSIKK